MLDVVRYALSAEQRGTYRRYAALPLPRPTSYPIAPAWRDDYRADEFRAELAAASQRGGSLSLYIHIPFCARLCYYCACTKEIVPHAKRQAGDPADR